VIPILLVILAVPSLLIGALVFGAVVLIRRRNAQSVPALISRESPQRRERKRDLSFMAGTWRGDPAFDEAIADQDKVDEELWR
jgi:uncharacterized iron-regulated membrane protein